MSVKLMTKTYEAHFHDIQFDRQINKKSGEQITKKVLVIAANLKSITVALADNANDEGEGAYPGLTTLEDKTELSRNTVISALKALKQENIIFYVGISKYGTNNYTVNKQKLIDMASWPKQERKKVVKPLHQPKGSEAAALAIVKPLHQSSEAATPDSSFNHPLTVGTNAPTRTGNTNPNTGRRTDAVVKGDPMDGIIAAAQAAQEVAARAGLPLEVLSDIQNFPEDCQQGARLMYQKFKLLPPSKPKSGRGGDYADWIIGIRDLAKLCSSYRVSLEKGFDEAYQVWNANAFIVDRPGGLVKAMKSSLARVEMRTGNLSKDSQKPPETKSVPNPFPRPKFRPTV